MNDVSSNQVLSDSYSVIGELWCTSPDVDPEQARQRANELLAGLQRVSPESATSLSRFLEGPPIDEQDYIDLFELQPRCPLYLGSHVFDEPKTCAGAAVSDRNEYMIELLGIYKHFGQTPNGKELPDYLPLMVDFLAMTVESNGDPIRHKFLEDYFLPFVQPMRKRLEEIDTPYLHLLDALEKVINHDLKAHSHVG